MTKYSHPTPFAELNELLDEMVRQIKAILGDNFVGAYLQGSFALGDADMYSDCDFLIVIAGPLTPAQEQAIRALHAGIRARPEHWVHHPWKAPTPVEMSSAACQGLAGSGSSSTRRHLTARWNGQPTATPRSCAGSCANTA